MKDTASVCWLWWEWEGASTQQLHTLGRSSRTLLVMGVPNPIS